MKFTIWCVWWQWRENISYQAAKVTYRFLLLLALLLDFQWINFLQLFFINKTKLSRLKVHLHACSVTLDYHTVSVVKLTYIVS